MAHVDIDIDKVVNPNDPAAAGIVKVEIQDCQLETSKASQLPMVHIEAVITGADNDEDLGKYLHDYCVLDGDGAKWGKWRYTEWCKAAGADGKDTETLIGIGGIEVQLSVEPGQGEYGPSNRIKKIFYDE